MNASGRNRFEDFFSDKAYILLKNHLYNYRLRRHAIKNKLQTQAGMFVLDVGSGVSPMAAASERTVYSELSLTALRTLKRSQVSGHYVVADVGKLPFKTGSFSGIICSELLEHLPDDQPALFEMASALKPGGSLILTFPHRRSYFAEDDRFVRHYRRYELVEMKSNLSHVGLNTVEIQKVLGPLEKITMLAVIFLIQLFDRFRSKKDGHQDGRRTPIFGFPLILLFSLMNRLYCIPAWLDARLAPRCLSSVLLIRAIKQDVR